MQKLSSKQKAESFTNLPSQPFVLKALYYERRQNSLSRHVQYVDISHHIQVDLTRGKKRENVQLGIVICM